MKEETKGHHAVNKHIVYLPGKEVKLYVPADFEALITDLEDVDNVPCWAAVWPAAYGLARFIWEQVTFKPGENVLELGAGMGLPGIVCGLKEAQLTFSDFHPQALQMAASNARINGVAAELLPEDWRHFACRRQFDTILASDLLYDPSLNPYLGKIFHQNLLPGGRIFIAHPQRRVTQEFIRSWFDPTLFQEKIYHQAVELEDALLPCYDIVIHLFLSLRPSIAKD